MLDCPEAVSLLRAAEVFTNISEQCFSRSQLPGLFPKASGRGQGGGRKEPGTAFSLSPPTCSCHTEFRAAESITRSKEDTAGWPLSKSGFLACCESIPWAQRQSISKKSGGGLILRTHKSWVADFLLTLHVVFQKTFQACLRLPALSETLSL